MKRTLKQTVAYLTLSGASMLSVPGYAETTLQALDGSFELKGDLLSQDAENYKINTEFGELIVRREFVKCLGDGCQEAPQAADAGSKQINLVSNDGSMRLEGTLVTLTDTDYVIDTVTGQLTVRKEFVKCEGTGCPEDKVESARFTVAVPGALGQEIISSIIGGYSSSKDYNLTQELGNGEVLASMLVGNSKGEEVAKIDINNLSSHNAIKAVLDGKTAFALTREKVTPQMLSEISGRQVRDVGDILTEKTIGLDALSFVVHKSNRIDVANIVNIRDILSGKVTNWSQLGGADALISVHLLSADKNVADQLNTRVMASIPISGNHILHESVEALNAAVNSDANAFGVMYRSQAEGVKPLDLVSECNVFFNNSDFAIQTEEYPLSVRWYQYSNKSSDAPPFASNVSDFIVTDVGQQSVASQGLVTQELRIAPMKDQGARLLTTVLASGNDRASNAVMREYLGQASNARRLSTSLRFLVGATDLDVKAIDDVQRISEIIRSNSYRGYEILIFGFSDAYGDVNANLQLSKGRAETVKAILLQENIGYLSDANVTTFGMGPIAPVDCNDSARGRELNRRVEIWIRPKS